MVLDELARVLRPGGRLALTAFSSYFAVRDLEEGEASTPTAGVLHEHTVSTTSSGRPADQDLWTTCYTPRELRLLLARSGLPRRATSGRLRPGAMPTEPPSIESPEHLVVARAAGESS